MAETKGFQGRILLVKETTFGTEPTNPAYKRFSDYVQSVSLSGNPRLVQLRDIGGYDVKEFAKAVKEFGLTVEFFVQRDTEIKDMVVRGTDNSLPSWSIELVPDLNQTTKTYYVLTGCKPNSVELSVEGPDGVLTASVEFIVKNVTTSQSTTERNIGTGSRESAIGTAVFNFVGGKVERPSGTAFAYITRSFSATIDNGLSAMPDYQAADVIKAILEGPRKITGTASVALEDGGKTQWDNVMAAQAADIVLYFGTVTGNPKWTFSGAVFDSLEFELSADSGEIFIDRPFTAKSLTVATV